MTDKTADVIKARSALAPEVRELLEYVDALQPAGDISLPDLRRILFEADNAFFRRTGSTAPEVGSIDEYRVPVEGGEIVIRCYLPTGDGPHPAVVHLHGGGFVFGSIDQLFYDTKCR